MTVRRQGVEFLGVDYDDSEVLQLHEAYYSCRRPTTKHSSRHGPAIVCKLMSDGLPWKLWIELDHAEQGI